jgi:hypothetical protein
LRKNRLDSTWIWWFGSRVCGPKICLVQARLDQGDVALEVGELRVQLEIGDDALEREAQAVGGRVVHAVGRGRFLGLDVLGGDSRAHEDEIVAEVAAVQDPLQQTVLKKVSASSGLLVVGQHADVVQFDFAPGLRRSARQVRIRLRAHARIPARAGRRNRCARARPAARCASRRVRSGSWRPGWSGGTAGSGLSKPSQDGARDVEGDPGRQQLGEVDFIILFARISKSPLIAAAS